jgi:hypothetical protein
MYVFLPEVDQLDILLAHVRFQKGMKAETMGSKAMVKCSDKGGQLRLQLPKKIKSMGKYVWVVKITWPNA